MKADSSAKFNVSAQSSNQYCQISRKLTAIKIRTNRTRSRLSAGTQLTLETILGTTFSANGAFGLAFNEVVKIVLKVKQTCELFDRVTTILEELSKVAREGRGS